MADSLCDWLGVTDGDYAVATNWSGIVPVNTDSVRIVKTATQAIDATLDQSAVHLKDFLVEQGCIVPIGKWSAAAEIEYLKIDLFSTTYWDATLRGTGETFLHLNEYRNLFIEEAGAGTNSNFGTNITGTIASGAGLVFVAGVTGSVGFATHADEVFEALAINLTDSEVTLGEGVYAADGAAALAVLKVSGGTVVTRCAMTTASITDSDYRHEKGAIGTLNVKGGTAVIAGALTIGTANVEAGATLDMTGDLQAKTLSATYMHKGSTLDIRGGHVTLTAVYLDGCAIQDITILTDPGVVVTFA